MVNLADGTMCVNREMQNISSYVVWFQTPKGLCVSVEEAMKVVAELDMGEMAIKPVPVAIGDKSDYEVLG